MATDRAVLRALLVIPIWGINSVTAVMSAYSSEIFPTRVRSRGTGLIAGASKAGGVLVIALVTLGVAALCGLTGSRAGAEQRNAGPSGYVPFPADCPSVSAGPEAWAVLPMGSTNAGKLRASARSS